MGLRIAMLSYHTCPLATLGGKDTGGMNVYVRDLTRQLGSMGVHVDVFTRSQDEHVPHVLHDLGYGNRVVHVPAGPEVPLPKPELAAFLPEFVDGIASFASRKKLHYDVIHSHYWMSGIAARDLMELWDLPVVHMFHTLGVMKNRVAREGEGEGDYRVQGEKEVMRLANRIVAATQAEKAQLQWLYRADPEKIDIIPPGVDTSHFYPIPNDEAKAFVGIPPEDLMILFVGRIEPLKGIDTLFKALALMRDEGMLKDYPLCLSIIGGEMFGAETAIDTEINRLQAMREDYGLGDMVTFLGRQSQDTLPYYYSAAAMVVMPSHYESFGMVALEAMACGTPVVASQVGGLAFLIKEGETGFLIPDQEPEVLNSRIMELVKNPQLRQEMGEKASLHAREYDWEIIATRILSLYDRVTAGHEHRSLSD